MHYRTMLRDRFVPTAACRDGRRSGIVMLRRAGLRLLLPALLLSAVAGIAGAGDVSEGAESLEERMLERLVTEDEYDSEWFSPEFRQQLSPVQLQGQIAGLIDGIGELEVVDGEDGEYTLLFDEALVPATISLDERDQIDAVFFQPANPRAETFDELSEQLRELPGDTAALVIEDGEALIEHNVDKAFSVASAFKLSVLAAVGDLIEDGSLSRDDVVEITEEDRSLPSGLMQDWPVGTAVTIDTLLVQMMSISDNTATDVLMRVAGRDQVDRYAGEHRRVPTTREMFAILGSEDGALAENWREADTSAELEAVLEEAASESLDRSLGLPSHRDRRDIGWMYTARQLAGLTEAVAGMEAAAVSRGAADAVDWDNVVYKDGYVPGAAAEVVHGHGEHGEEYTVVLLWNRDDEDVDVLGLYGFALSAVRMLE